MRILRKISFALSITFLIISVLVTIMCSFLDQYVIIGNLGTSQLLSILTAVCILFFTIYILTKGISKKNFIILSIFFLILGEIILIFVAFYPCHQYTSHISDDNAHVIVVEEKSTSTETAVNFYRKTFWVFHKPIENFMFSDAKKDRYQFGDYIIDFDDKHTKITMPILSDEPYLTEH